MQSFSVNRVVPSNFYIVYDLLFVFLFFAHVEKSRLTAVSP